MKEITEEVLVGLTKEIPYKWRVQSFSKNVPKAQCVAFIDARDVMELLDGVVGSGNWQSDYKDIGGQMFAGIGIRVNGEWVWKWDTGSESNIEKEKGQSSDSFKRAGVKWGIGRFLYSLDIKFVDADARKGDSDSADGKVKKFPNVVDRNGKKVFDVTKLING